MSIRVQCDQCGSVMNIREDYAGTERHCPKCKHTFRVPTAAEAAAQKESVPSSAKKSNTPSSPDFDPIAFLTGEDKAKKPAAPKQAAGKETAPPKAAKKPSSPAVKDEFDPLDVLDEGAPPRPKAEAKPEAKSPGKASKPKSAPDVKAEDFDPLDVLGPGTKPAKAEPAAASPAPPKSPPPPPEKPAPPDAEQVDSIQKDFDPLDVLADAPKPPSSAPAAQQAPTPKRPSWAKPPPEPELEDWKDEPSAPEPPKPKRPSWAKPLPGEEPKPEAAGGSPTAVAADASPAAKAAATAMEGPASVSKANPALQTVEKRPWIDRAALVAGLKRRLRLMLTTLATAAVLFAVAWLLVRPDLELPPLAPVDGTVTVNGKPLAGARVIFTPRGLEHRSAEAVTDSEGRYRLEFFEGLAGAPLGRYRVSVQLVAPTGRDMIPVQFGSQTQQTAVVREGGSTIDIKIGEAPEK